MTHSLYRGLLVTVILLLAATGCQKTASADRQEEDSTTAAGRMAGSRQGKEEDPAKLAARMAKAQTPEEAARIMEEAVAGDGIHISVVTGSDGEPVGWRDAEAGTEFLTGSRLEWPKALPETIPRPEGLYPTASITGENSELVLIFEPVSRSAAQNWRARIRAAGWSETGYTEEGPIFEFRARWGEETLILRRDTTSLVLEYLLRPIES